MPDTVEMLKAGEYFSWVIAKAIKGKAYYDGDRPLEPELDDFAKSIDRTNLPSMVFCCLALLDGGMISPDSEREIRVLGHRFILSFSNVHFLIAAFVKILPSRFKWQPIKILMSLLLSFFSIRYAKSMTRF